MIQARMGSTRLPGKVLAPVAGKPMLWHVIQRTRSAKSLNQVMVVTSKKSEDNPLAEFCTQSMIDCFRGSEEDVLDRYYQAARECPDATIVRITADCPLVDPEVIDKVVSTYQLGSYDYVSNVHPRSYPDGLDVEVFSLATLERTWHEAVEPHHREHVTSYMSEHPERFRIGNVAHRMDLSAMRWSVDYPQDMQFIRVVYDRIKDRHFGLAEVVALLKSYPELTQINAGIEQV